MPALRSGGLRQQRAGVALLRLRLRPRPRVPLRDRRLRSDDLDELAPAACVHALGQSRARSTVPFLVELLREGNDELQRQAAWALGNVGDAAAVGPLLRAVFVKREPIRC